jgi:hypothetical protein
MRCPHWCANRASGGLRFGVCQMARVVFGWILDPQGGGGAQEQGCFVCCVRKFLVLKLPEKCMPPCFLQNPFWGPEILYCVPRTHGLGHLFSTEGAENIFRCAPKSICPASAQRCCLGGSAATLCTAIIGMSPKAAIKVLGYPSGLPSRCGNASQGCDTFMGIPSGQQRTNETP